MGKEKGITLVSLAVTIIVLIILAGVSINLVLGENGIITKSQEAKKKQIIAEAKEKIGMDIVSAQIEATETGNELEKQDIETIISQYGQLQEDGDTIILKDSNYSISLLEIFTGSTDTGGNRKYCRIRSQNSFIGTTNYYVKGRIRREEK